MTGVADNVLFLIDLLYCLLRIFMEIFKSVFETVFAKKKSVIGEVVLITGAGHGIGRELAIKYGRLGATVVCWDVNEESNEETVKMVKRHGGKVFGYTTDVSDCSKVMENSKKVKTEVGMVTILINNAGIMRSKELLHHSEVDVRQTFDVNVLSHYWTLKAFLPKMIESNRGQVIGISSMAGISGIKNFTAYSASKFAVRGLYEALREELRLNSSGKSKVKITTVYPFFTNTGIYELGSVTVRSSLFTPILTTKEVVKEIIRAQRSEVEEVSVPPRMLYFETALRLLPKQAYRAIFDFMDVKIAPQ